MQLRKLIRETIRQHLNESVRMESVYGSRGFDVKSDGRMHKDGVDVVIMVDSVYEVFNGSVSVYPAFKNEHVDILELISVPEGERKKGLASKVLDEIIEISSEYGRTLQLYPMPLKDGSMGISELTSWYERKGFVMRDDGIMVKTP